jgi:hypothetical protein
MLTTGTLISGVLPCCGQLDHEKQSLEMASSHCLQLITGNRWCTALPKKCDRLLFSGKRSCKVSREICLFQLCGIARKLDRLFPSQLSVLLGWAFRRFMDIHGPTSEQTAF